MKSKSIIIGSCVAAILIIAAGLLLLPKKDLEAPDYRQAAVSYVLQNTNYGPLDQYVPDKKASLKIGNEIPVYAVKDGKLDRMPNRVFPVLDAEGTYLFEVNLPDLAKEEIARWNLKEDSIPAAASDDGSELKRDYLKQSGARIALVYSDTAYSLLVDDTLYPILRYETAIGYDSLDSLLAEEYQKIPVWDSTAELIKAN